MTTPPFPKLLSFEPLLRLALHEGSGGGGEDERCLGHPADDKFIIRGQRDAGHAADVSEVIIGFAIAVEGGVERAIGVEANDRERAAGRRSDGKNLPIALHGDRDGLAVGKAGIDRGDAVAAER